MLEAVRRAGRSARPVSVLVTADEEIGGPSRPPERRGAGAGAREAVLVLEPPVQDGTITTARSGLARYRCGSRARPPTRVTAGGGRLRRRGSWSISRRRVPRAGARVSAASAQRRPGGGWDGRQRRRRRGVGANQRAHMDGRGSAGTARGSDLRARGRGSTGAKLDVSGAVTRPPMVQSGRRGRARGRAIEIARGLGSSGRRECVTAAAPTATSPPPSAHGDRRAGPDRHRRPRGRRAGVAGSRTHPPRTPRPDPRPCGGDRAPPGPAAPPPVTPPAPPPPPLEQSYRTPGRSSDSPGPTVTKGS